MTEYKAVREIDEEYEPETLGITSWDNLMLIKNDKTWKAWGTNCLDFPED